MSLDFRSDVVKLWSPPVQSAELQEVPIWSVHKPHGVIPPQLIERAMDYYRLKGKDNIVADFERQQQHSHLVRAARPQKQAAHQEPGILPGGQKLEVYTAKNKKKLRKELVRDSEKRSTDRSVNEAYDGAKQTYDLLFLVYKTKSIDGKRFPLIATVHYDRNYSNAFWDGDEMVYGDGDRKIFNSFTSSIDICGHEIGHGATQELCGTKVSLNGKPTGVDYENEAGGINEAYSDILGIQVKQRFNGQTAEQSDWLIGQGLLSKRKGKEYALRSMSNPGTGFVDHPDLGTDSQIWKYGDYKKRAEQGEVDPHDSSGVVNKAFYVSAMKLGGSTWEKAGRIYFESMPYIKVDETFAGLADKTIATAIRIFGEGSAEESAVREGWKVVEVKL
jgi:Zn-dependent metalloprotease